MRGGLQVQAENYHAPNVTLIKIHKTWLKKGMVGWEFVLRGGVLLTIINCIF